jgi:Putative prokaryotic signal transducing protein
MQLVTVFRSFSPAEAQLIRSRLDAADIPAEVVNELAALSMDGYSMAGGGIRVQVPDEYAAEARALIDSANTSTDEAATE